jgi:SM-20-related protein
VFAAAAAAAPRIAAMLLTDEFVVHDGYLDAEETRMLADCARRRHDRGEFSPARIGPAGGAQQREDLRGDATCWLAPPLVEAEAGLLSALEALRLALNRDGLLGLFDLEMHYSRYSCGARYARHVDQPRGRGQRRVSVVLYLNADWPASAGGALRVFDPASAHRDILPIGGRLVCFFSAGREHAVQPARRLRLALSGWYRTRD